MSVVDEYLAKLETPQRMELERLRKIIVVTVPEAEEVINYGMPAYRYKGEYLIGFYVYKNHMSLFPTPKPIAALRSQLGKFQLSKGTIQFTVDNIIPESIVRKLLLYQIYDIDRLHEQ